MTEQAFIGWKTIWGAEDGKKSSPYLTRIWIWRLRLHVFHRGDEDQDCHDHPWDFWTFPLTSYFEEVLTIKDGQAKLSVKRVRALWLHFRPAEYKHRVLYRNKGQEKFGKIITIVWSTNVKRKWGFLKIRDGRHCWIPWKQYIYEGGSQGPCE